MAISVTTGLVLFLLVVIIRLLYEKRAARKQIKLHMAGGHPFTDDLSDIDADISAIHSATVSSPISSSHSQGQGRIDHSPNLGVVGGTSTLAGSSAAHEASRSYCAGGRPSGNGAVTSHSVETVPRFNTRTSLHRQNSDTNPRSLQRPNNHQLFYS